MRHFFVPILLILLITSVVPTFAQVEPAVSASTDKSSYVEGDTIVVSGKVKSVLIGTPIILQVFDPDNNRIEIAQINPAQDGSYTHTINAVGSPWKKDGEYTVQVFYGPASNAMETTFLFSTKGAVLETKQIFQVDTGGFGAFDVEYIIKGATVKDMVIDVKGSALIVSIDSQSDGSVTLDISRELIDAKTSTGNDDSFIILIDGSEVPYQETKSLTSRTLTIQFLEGDSDIEIIGTYIIPEFGIIAAMILAVAILSMIGLSVRTKLKIIPKF